MPLTVDDFGPQLRRQGYAVVPGFLSESELQVLLEECDLLVEQARDSDPLRAYEDPQWAATVRGCVFEAVGGQHVDGAAFRSLRRKAVPGASSAAACELLFGPAMQHLVHAALGVPGYLFNDQYIVKPPHSRASAFPWHRDSDWLDEGAVTRHPYISVWCALHDMTEDNGTLMIRPHSHAQANFCEERTIEASAGAAVVMSDGHWHCSRPNLSAYTRAAWMPQFSTQPILYHSTGQPVSIAVKMTSETAVA